MIIKKFDENSLDALLEFLKISMPRDKFTKELLVENIIEDMVENPELCLAAYDNQDLIGFGLGVIRSREDEDMAYIKFLAVHPDHKRKGIAKNIYLQIEQGIIEKGIKKIRLVESWPNYYMPGIDPFYTEAVAFFERFGYIKVGDAANLICDLESQNFGTTNDEEKAKTIGVEIRRSEKTDTDTLMEWTAKNFKEWRFEISNALKNDPISVHLAILDNEIIAFSAYEGNNRGLGWFGPVGTTEAARGKGVGGILLKRCLQDMKDAGHKEAIIPWVAHIPFYMHYINSKVNRIFWRYEKILK